MLYLRWWLVASSLLCCAHSLLPLPLFAEVAAEVVAEIVAEKRAQAQVGTTVDSLWRLRGQQLRERNDTLANLVLGEITKARWGNEPDSAMHYAWQMLQEAERMGFRHGAGIALNNIAYIEQKKGNYDRCLEYSYKSLAIMEALGDKVYMAWCYHNIGNVHYYQGRYGLALENHIKALEVREQIGDKQLIAWSVKHHPLKPGGLSLNPHSGVYAYPRP